MFELLNAAAAVVPIRAAGVKKPSEMGLLLNPKYHKSKHVLISMNRGTSPNSGLAKLIFKAQGALHHRRELMIMIADVSVLGWGGLWCHRLTGVTWFPSVRMEKNQSIENVGSLSILQILLTSSETALHFCTLRQCCVG